MKRDLVIAISGTDGFLGAALEARLRAAGHTVLPLPREIGLLPGCDVLIQLGCGDLVSKLPDAVALPKVFIYGSSTDYYGHRPGEPLDEASPPGRGPRAAAEADARRAEALGIRTVVLRFGEILDPSGGYLGRMLPLMRHGFCFVMGNPDDRFAWISLEDALRLIEFAMRNDHVRGTMNAVAPVAATQGAFARVASAMAKRRLLGRLRSRFLRTRLGVLADIQDVAPARALQEGFGFVHPTLQFWRSHESRTA
jgi:NAD dependent epimerase/dehydratase family enzyme